MSTLIGIERAQRMYQVIGSERDWNWPSEAEARALLVVPLLLDCGPRAEHLSLEWNRIDVAVFRSGAPRWDDCLLVVEVKRPGRGLASARRQGAGYVEAHHRHRVPVLTTNGFAWTLYRHPDGHAPLSAFLPELSRSSLPFFDALISCVRPS